MTDYLRPGWVRMEKDGEQADVTQEAFTSVWQDKGWTEVSSGGPLVVGTTTPPNDYLIPEWVRIRHKISGEEAMVTRAALLEVWEDLGWRGYEYAEEWTVLDLPGTAGSYASTPWLGSNPKGLYLPGGGSSYAIAGSTADLQITGDVDLRCDCQAPDWSIGGGAYQSFIVKRGSQAEYAFRINSGGTPEFYWWDATAGAYITVQGSTTVYATGLLDAQRAVLRGTRRWTAPGTYEVAFYYSLDDEQTWIPIGAPVVGAGSPPTPTLFGLTVGSVSGSQGLNLGMVYRASVRNGVDGPVVFDVDFTDESQGWAVGDSNGATGIDATGKVVTISGASSKIRSTFDITGDIDIRVYDLAADAWASGSTQRVVTKYGTVGANRSWAFSLGATGTISGAVSIDGVAALAYTRDPELVGPPVVDGQPESFRFTRIEATGMMALYRMVDGAWALVDTDASTVGPVWASTVDVAIGARLAAEAEHFAGSIGRIEVRDGIDGEVVASADFTHRALGEATFEDDQGNIWSVAGDAELVAV